MQVAEKVNENVEPVLRNAVAVEEPKKEESATEAVIDKREEEVKVEDAKPVVA